VTQWEWNGREFVKREDAVFERAENGWLQPSS
jgi:hypothetical protein